MTFALNSKGLFHSHKLLFQTKYFCKPRSSFYILHIELKIPKNTKHKKTAPTTPIAAGCVFFRDLPTPHFHDLAYLKETQTEK